MESLAPVETPTTDVAGLMLVDKPAGVTSHDVVAIARRAAGGARAGHTGTLDPLATGLLVILLGRGTRLIPYVDGEPKVYEATIRFGSETDTDDSTGEVTREAPPPAPNAVEDSIAQLTGDIEQVPPAYSAKKQRGVRGYDAARRGAALDLAPSRVVVHGWEILERSPRQFDVRITCSGGTYVRALARDLGRLAHSAAHLSRLRRLAMGRYRVDDAVTVDELRDGALPVRPLRDAIPSMPTQSLAASERAAVVRGRAIAAHVPGERVALVDGEQRLIAVAERRGDELQPRVVLADA